MESACVGSDHRSAADLRTDAQTNTARDENGRCDDPDGKTGDRACSSCHSLSL
jgi:hypothetical protein